MGAIAKATVKSLKALIDDKTNLKTPLTDVNKLLADVKDTQLKKQAIEYFKKLKAYRNNLFSDDSDIPKFSTGTSKTKTPTKKTPTKKTKTALAVIKGEGPKRVGSEKTKVPGRSYDLTVPKGSKSKKVEDVKEKRGFTDKEKDKTSVTKSTSKNKQRLKDLVKNKKIIIGGVGGAGALVVASSLFDMPTKADKKDNKKSSSSKSSTTKKNKAQSTGGTRTPTDRRTMGKSKRASSKKNNKREVKKQVLKKTSKYDKYEVYDPSFLGVRSRLKKKSK